MQLQDAHALFQTQLEADGRSASTRNLYAAVIDAFDSWLTAECHSCDLVDIDHMILARFVASDFLRTRKDGSAKKSSTLNTTRSALRVFLRYCHATGIATADHGRFLRRAICSPPPPRALSQRDQEKLRCALAAPSATQKGERDRFLVRFLLATGLRLDSGLRLRIEDIDLDDGSMRVHVKRDRTQVFFMPEAIRNEMSAFLAGRTSGPVFAGAAGRRLGKRQAQRRVAELARRAGLSVARPHSLRHSFAVELYERSRDLALVSRALGHSTVVSTQRYAGATDEQLRRAMG